MSASDVKTASEFPELPAFLDRSKSNGADQESELLIAAQAYARRDWPVLPLHSATDGLCSCGKPSCQSPGKHPRTKHGVKDATTDPVQIKEWWGKSPDANIGIATGEKSGVIVIDIDGPKGEAAIAQFGDLPQTPVVRTAKGRHLYFKHPGFPVGNRVRAAPEVDIRGDGGYVVAPPSVHANGTIYKWETSLDEAPLAEPTEPILNLLKADSRKQAGGNEESGLVKIEEGKRNSTLTSLAGTMRHRGMGMKSIAAALLEDNRSRCQPPLAEIDVRQIAKSVSRYRPGASDDPNNPLVQKLNKQHAVVSIGGKTTILNEGRDPILRRISISFSTPADFRTAYQNIPVFNGKKMTTAGTFWLNHAHRRQFEGIVFSPDKDVAGYYNLWTGFAVTPKKGNFSLYLDHIQNVIACGDDEVFEYLLAWMADAVQNASRRPGTAIVLRGKQGVGKGVFCTQFGKLFGQHFLPIFQSKHLTGHFNAHLKDALVVFADEAFWAGDKSAEGVLKAMVTEETLPIELKGKDPIFIQNHIRLIVSSNHDWVVPAGLEERRFCVLNVSEAKMQEIDYFAAIINQMDNGGREALLEYLLNYDLTNIDLHSFPQTDALFQQKFHSMTPIQKWWFGRLTDGAITSEGGKWEEWVRCKDVHDDFINITRDAGHSRRAVETELGMELRKLVPNLPRKRRKDGSYRSYGYEFPSLDECRSEFDRLTRTKTVWPDEDI